MKLYHLILLITLFVLIRYKPILYFESGNWILMYGRGSKRKTKILNF